MAGIRGYWAAVGVLIAVIIGLWPGEAARADESLVLYAGRSKTLVQPIISRFTRETGIDVVVSYGATAQKAVQLLEEGDRSPADVFWAQDAGALGALVSRGMLATLPASVLESVPEIYHNPEGQWVATSGRARVLAYSPGRVDASELPQSVFDLTKPAYRGRVGWAPTNASFQAFVTAIRRTHGQDAARQWLEAMKANGAAAYSNNSAIIRAIAAGEIDFGLPNHYYLLRFKDKDANYPVAQTTFAAGDIGNMVNVAGVGILASSDRQASATRLVEYLLSAEAQNFFADEIFEYPVTGEASSSAHITAGDRALEAAPQVDLDSLEDLEGTLDLLREVGLL